MMYDGPIGPKLIAQCKVNKLQDINLNFKKNEETM